jgi:hypothetical protein
VCRAAAAAVTTQRGWVNTAPTTHNRKRNKQDGDSEIERERKVE